MKSVRTLLDGIIDYAGLFPPAALDMERAVANYSEYRSSPAQWALGRFVVPAARLEELERAAVALLPQGADEVPWRVSALGGADLAADLRRIEEFNRRHAGAIAERAVVDVVEVKAATPRAIADAAAALPRPLDVYVEIPVTEDPRPLVEAIARAGVRAKVRTGGITPDAIPPAAILARFLERCVEAGVPCKATAGLHHPIRASYPLTYEQGAPEGTMFGFLNVALAAAYLRAGATHDEAVAILEERATSAFRFDDGGVTWRGRRLTTDQLAATRADTLTAFGSCSFREPVDELATLALLPLPEARAR